MSRQMLWFPISKYIVPNKPLGIACMYYETDDNGVPRIFRNEDYEDTSKTLFRQFCIV
jgi:hypothetical protein